VSLIIAESEETDSAVYRCEAVNKFGKVQAKFSVVVLRKFRIVSTLDISTLAAVPCLQWRRHEKGLSGFEPLFCKSVNLCTSYAVQSKYGFVGVRESVCLSVCLSVSPRKN